MPTRPVHWSLVYSVSWAVALTLPFAVALALTVRSIGCADGDGTLVLGALLGALLGAFVARCTRSSPTLHRVLRLGGPVLAAVAFSASLYLFHLASERRLDGPPFSGLGEFLLALLLLCVVGLGAALWLAGVSGRRMAAAPPA